MTRIFVSLMILATSTQISCNSSPGSSSSSAASSSAASSGTASSGSSSGGSTPGFSISRSFFGKTNDGKEVSLFTLKNKKGITVGITNYGGIITTLSTPDKAGKMADIVLGYDNLNQYFDKGDPYFGALVGRYANRIAKASFKLDGATYKLAANDHTNTLHGGLKGFDKVVWDAAEIKDLDSVGLSLKYLSPDGEEGFPGTLRTTVKYVLTNDDFKIDYSATTDKATVLNLTNHSYFNLSGGAQNDILGHELTLYATKYTPVTKDLIPTGQLSPVASTPMDFTHAHKIGDALAKVEGGYDHNYVLDHKAGHLDQAAVVYDPSSGRVMTILTTQPGIQFYSGNFLDGSQKGKQGVFYTKHYALALETQHFPDSPNQPSFPSVVLKPGETYHEQTVYRFSVK